MEVAMSIRSATPYYTLYVGFYINLITSLSEADKSGINLNYSRVGSDVMIADCFSQVSNQHPNQARWHVLKIIRLIGILIRVVKGKMIKV